MIETGRGTADGERGGMNGRDARARLRADREPTWFRAVLFLASCIPPALAIGWLSSDIMVHTRFLGSNPVKEGEHFLGEWTLRFLIATLCVTPLRQLLGWNWLAKHRRTLGLFAFATLTLHWLTYALLDVQLDWGDLVKDLMKRPYIMIGMTGLVLMLALALTSTRDSIRRLGGKWWNRLHRAIYVVCVLGVIHFWMSVKKDISDPLMFASIFAVLFAYRGWRWAARRTKARVT